MKKLILLFCVSLPFCLFSQNTQEQQYNNYQDSISKNFQDFVDSKTMEFNNFRDSINLVFAKALEEQWTEFQVFQGIPAPLKPKPKTLPVADTLRKEPHVPVEIPIEEVVPPREEKPKPEPPKIEIESKPVLPEDPSINYIYKEIYLWNTTYKIPYDLTLENLSLTSVQEKTIADFLRALTHTNYQPVVKAITEIKNKCDLNHYGLALLCNEYAKSVWTNRPNETTTFFVFLLNQLSLDAKIARISNELYPVIHSPQDAYAISYTEIDHKKYYFLFSKIGTAKVYTYKIKFSEQNTGLDFNIYKPVNISPVFVDKELLVKKLNKTVKLPYSQGAIEYYRNYPQVEADIYANAAVSDAFKSAIIRQFKPLITGKKEAEAADILLNFMLTTFKYKTDTDQYGYEKWNFCEENLYYPYNDCDDRAILFSYLVRILLDLDVVLIKYSNHMSTAVHFNDEVKGDYLTIDGKKYIICDPTYNEYATIGMNPSEYLNEIAKIIRTKKL